MADAVPFAASRCFAAEMPGARLWAMENVDYFPSMEAPVTLFTALNSFLRREDAVE